MARLGLLALFGAIISLLAVNHSFAEAKDQPKKTTIEKLSPESIQEAVENAIKGIESQKRTDEEQLRVELDSELDRFIRSWLSDAGTKKKAELNRFLHQDWEIPARATYPIPFDYYLRGYDYALSKKDLLKTNSLTNPYKAVVNIIEKQYIESYHASSASDKRQYYYTVTRPITLNLDYQQDNLYTVNTHYGQASFERGWNK